MFKKLNWRIVALIAFVIAAGGFIYWNVSTVQQMKKQAALFEKMLEKEKEPVVAKEPPPAAPGKKWVPHGDHFHEVPIDAPDVWQGEPHESVHQPVTTYKNNGEYIEIDYSFLDKPEEAIHRHAEIRLNPEKYSQKEYDRAGQEARILLDKISEGYYGKGERRDELEKLADEVYWNPILAKQGLSVEKLQQMVRGEIPPLVIPIDPKVVKPSTNDGGDK